MLSRRTASMSFRCAVVVIRPAALSVMPFSGQVASAAEEASCIASSARSKEPEIRISPARIRPDSWRNTASATERTSAIPRDGLTSGDLQLRTHGDTKKRTNLDAAFAAFAHGRDARGPLDGLVQAFTIQDVVAGELLLGFGEGAVGDDGFAIFDSDGGCRRRGGEGFGGDEDALRAASSMSARWPT